MADDAALPSSSMELTNLNPSYRADPHALLDPLRRARPRLQDAMALFLTTQADGRAALADAALSRDPRKAPEGAPTRMMAPSQLLSGQTPGNMLWFDDPEHRINRGLVQPAFFRRCAGMRARVTTIVGDLLDGIARKRTFDGIADFAVPLPVFVIADILGFPRSDLGKFRAWSSIVGDLTFVPFRTPEQDSRLEETGALLERYFLEAITARRAAPHDDLIADLIAAEFESERLDDPHIVGLLFALLLAGNLTTTDLIGNGIVELLEHPAEAARLRADPKLARGAVEEILRFAPPVAVAARHVNTDQTVLGCPLAAGTSVVASLEACNRDPAVFADPHVFRIDRERNEHMAFGGGAHQCLGAPLARLEGEIALASLFTRFPDLRLAEGRPERKASFGFNGYERLPLSVEPA